MVTWPGWSFIDVRDLVTQLVNQLFLNPVKNLKCSICWTRFNSDPLAFVKDSKRDSILEYSCKYYTQLFNIIFSKYRSTCWQERIRICGLMGQFLKSPSKKTCHETNAWWYDVILDDVIKIQSVLYLFLLSDVYLLKRTQTYLVVTWCCQKLQWIWEVGRKPASPNFR